MLSRFSLQIIGSLVIICLSFAQKLLFALSAGTLCLVFRLTFQCWRDLVCKLLVLLSLCLYFAQNLLLSLSLLYRLLELELNNMVGYVPFNNFLITLLG